MEGVTFITTATETVVSVMETVISTITGNAILALCFTAGTIIPLGVALFKRLKK